MLSGHKVIPLNEEEQSLQEKHFEAYSDGVIRLSPGNWFLLNSFVPFMDKYYTFQFKPTDVVVLTFAKCGTTWMQEIIWTMENNPDLNNPMASLGVNMRCPFLEADPIILVPTATDELRKDMAGTLAKLSPGKDPKDGVFIQLAEHAPEPRIIKSHFPLSLLTPNMLDTCKVVYVARNPKDVCVSYHHHSRLIKGHGYVGDFDTFVNYFVNDELMFSPYGTHLTEAWQKRHHKNMHFVFYEDMKANPRGAIVDLNKFLGTNLTENQIDNVLDYTSFKSMKSRDNVMGGSSFMNPDVLAKDGGFYRKGAAGGFKDKMNLDQEKKIEDWAKRTAPEIPFKF